jgi:hypothetical protein
MSLGRVQAVGTVGGERSRALRLEREADDRAREERLNAPVKAKIDELTQEAARTAGRVVAEEKRAELNRVRHELTSAPSPDFITQDYDGRFKSAAEVTAGIDAAYAAFKARTADADVQLTYDFLQAGNWQKADTSRLEVWESAYQFCLRKLKEVEDKYVAPAPEPVVEPTPIAPEARVAAELQAQIDALPVGNSREKERLERLLHQHQISAELILRDDMRETLAEIVDQSGLAIPKDCNLKFRQWLAAPMQRRFTNSREDVRIAWAEFTGQGDTFLTPEEKIEIDRRKRVGALSADQVKAITGSTNTYGYDAGRRG